MRDLFAADLAAAARAYLRPPGPRRQLVAVNFINSLGNGMFMTAGAVFYIRYLHLSVAIAGAGLAVGGMVSLISGVLVGPMADRRGARGTYAASLAAQTVTMLAFTVAHNPIAFVLTTSAASLTQVASASARGPLIRGYAGGSPTQFRALLALGLLLAGGVALTVGELLVSAGSMELSFRLAPAEQQGAYSGAYAMGQGLVLSLAPIGLSFLVLDQGRVGWMILALLMPLAAFWVSRSVRERAGDPQASEALT